MNCEQIRERLLAWQYGELQAAEQTEVAKHLAGCAACREELSGWQEFRHQLGAFTGPAVRVDMPGLYQEAMRRSERRAWRWRRSALVAAAVAALVLIAVGLKLEVRVDAAQLVVRWGNGEGARGRRGEGEKIQGPLAAADSLGATVVPGPQAGPQVTAEDLALVKNLVRALAQDVRTRDRQQQKALSQMQARFESFLNQVDKYVAANERDKAAFYTAQFRLQKKGDHQ
jgi:anti-sigma factor RsiW